MGLSLIIEYRKSSPQKKVMTVTQTTQSPNMTGHTQTGNAAKNFEEKQQRLAEGSSQPVMLSGAEMLVQALTDEGVVVFQAHWRGRATRRAIKGDKALRRMKTRKNVSKEIVATELSYVQGLEMLVAFFSRPCQNFLSPDEATAVFSYIEMILPCLKHIMSN